MTRDAFAISLLWNTGINACNICCQYFWHPGSTTIAAMPLLGFIYPHMQLVAEDKVLVVPQRLKTIAGANHTSIPIILPEDSIMDPITWLHQCLVAAALCGQPISRYIVRSSIGHGKTFNNAAITTSSMHNRLEKWLAQLGLDEGESMHSFRRGRAQHLKAQGLSAHAAGNRLLIKTTRVVKERYLPPGRYDSGSKRIRT